MLKHINTFRQFGLACALASCSSMASAGLMIDSITVKMTNTSFSARSTNQLSEENNAVAFDNARSAFDNSFGQQSFCDRSLDALVDVTARQTCGGSKRDYGAQYTITGTNTGITDFQFGLDWGRGGFISFESDGAEGDLLRQTNDVWWSRNWGNGDVINYRFDQLGDFTLTLLGFEGCCDGVNSVRYRSAAFDDIASLSPGSNAVSPVRQNTPVEWTILSVNASEVPVPGSLALIALGAGLLLRRRRS